MVHALTKTMRRVCALQGSVRWKSSAAGVWGLDSPMYDLTDRKVIDRVLLFCCFWVCYLQTACSHLNTSTWPCMFMTNYIRLHLMSYIWIICQYTHIIFKLSDEPKYAWPCNMLSLHLIVPWLMWEWRNLLSNMDHHRWSAITLGTAMPYKHIRC